jgi:hypothetical protein
VLQHALHVHAKDARDHGPYRRREAAYGQSQLQAVDLEPTGAEADADGLFEITSTCNKGRRLELYINIWKVERGDGWGSVEDGDRFKH